MRKLPLKFLTIGLMGCFAVGHASADSLSLGLDYNLVALTGGINYSGPDVEGSIAAAGNINFNAQQSWQTLAVGSKLTSNANDPYAIAAGGAITTSNGAHITVNGGGTTSGNAVSGTASNPSIFYGSPIANSHGTLTQGTYWTTSGLSQLDGIAKQLSATYASMSTAGTTISNSSSRINLTVSAPSPAQKAYVFNITASQFSDPNNALWINSVPAGATVVINVSGCSTFVSGGKSGCVMNLTPFLNGTQLVSADFSHIVFNFTDTTSQNLIVNQQLDGLILAPYSALEGGGDVGGTIWVASDASSGEIHKVQYDGYVPTPHPPSVVTPEPGTLGLLGTGLLSLAGLVRRRRSLCRVRS